MVRLSVWASSLHGLSSTRVPSLLDSCAPMYCGPGATRPRTCRSLRREAEGGAAQARGAGGFTRTVARFGWVQRSVRLLVFACSFFFRGVCFRGLYSVGLGGKERDRPDTVPSPSRTLRPAQLEGGRRGRGPATADGRGIQAGSKGEPHGGSPHGPRERLHLEKFKCK